jgi:hypothetical protein
VNAGGGLAMVPGRDLLTLAVAGTWLAAAAHLLSDEYPVANIGDDLDRRWPFLHAEGLALAFVLAAAGWAAVRSARPADRLLAAFGGFAFVLYTLPFELSGTALVGAWSLAAIGAVALWRVGSTRGEWTAALGALGRVGFALPALAAAGLATAHLVAFEYPLGDLAGEFHRRPPVVNGDGWTEKASSFPYPCAGSTAGHPLSTATGWRFSSCWSPSERWESGFAGNAGFWSKRQGSRW